MSNIRVQCIDQAIGFKNTPTITSGNVNYDTITFDFCERWTDYAKTAIFYRSKDEVYYRILDENDTCKIPNEVLTTKGLLYIGVFGVLDDVTITSEIISYRIQEGAITEGLEPSDPTPDIYAQIISRYNDFELELARQSEKIDSIENTVNEIIDGTAKVGDADKLDGHDSEYFATAQSVTDLEQSMTETIDKIVNGDTKVSNASEADTAGDSNKLGGNSPEYYATAQSVTNVNEKVKGFEDGTVKVAKASTADSATTAESATTAGSATSATNADTVDGFHFVKTTTDPGVNASVSYADNTIIFVKKTS